MRYLFIDALVLALLTSSLVLLFRWLAKDARRIADERRAAGLDPDDLYLRVIADRQAREKRRFRGPVGWYMMWYLRWERRQVMRHR